MNNKDSNKYKSKSEPYKSFKADDIYIKRNNLPDKESYTIYFPEDLVRRPFAKDDDGNFIEHTGVKQNGEEYTYKQRIDFVSMPKGTILTDTDKDIQKDVSGWSFVPHWKCVNKSYKAPGYIKVAVLANGINNKTGQPQYLQFKPPLGSEAYNNGEKLISNVIKLLDELEFQGAKYVKDASEVPPLDNEKLKDITTKDRITERTVCASQAKSGEENIEKIKTKATEQR